MGGVLAPGSLGGILQGIAGDLSRDKVASASVIVCPDSIGQIGTMKKSLQEKSDASQRRAFKIREAGEMLGLSDSSVRRLIHRGEIRPCRVLRHVLIPAAELDRLLSK
jgi:excisionase family DNA binding protein